MIYLEVTMETNKGIKLDWNANGINNIVQNVHNLINTFRYEVAYDRTKGIDPSILDKPATQAKALYISEIYRMINTYEPRAKVKQVDFVELNDGNMQFKVVIEV